MKRENLLYGLCGALALACAGLGWSNHSSSQRIDNLQAELDSLTEESKKSEVVKRISQQMEDIAYQQKAISDAERDKAVLLSEEAQQQRRVAERQTATANQMRRRAEQERSNAVTAEKQAMQSAAVAEEQRRIADEQRVEAETSKRVADTLSYVALARSLGALATTRYTSGDKELASLLAYGAWYYSHSYRGDVFYPAIFNALSVTSGNKTEWDYNRGGITKLISYNDDFITVSNYGEVMRWEKNGNGMSHKMIFSDKDYDFRDATINEGTLYAIARDGEIVAIPLEGNGQRAASDFAEGFFSQFLIDGKWCITYEDQQIFVLDRKSMRVDHKLEAPAPVTCISTYRGKPVVFTNKGEVYFLENGNKLVKELSMGIGNVCSFTSTPDGSQIAFGTENGMVYVMDYPRMSNIKKLRGHQSKVSQVGFINGYLITASYDRTLKLWDPKAEKMEPITLNTFGAWLTCFHADGDKYLWTGDATGTLTRLDVSPESMARTIHKNINRDLTRQEWNYYVGKEVPFTSFKNTQPPTE